jgi:hypothetical protein
LADANNNPVGGSGRSVTWSSTGGGSFSTNTSTTAPNGVATVTFTCSVVAGTVQTVTGSDNQGLSGTSGNITTVVGSAAKYLVNVSNYAPVAGDAVTITAQLVDVNSNVVSISGRVVTWSKSGSGGSFATSTSTTSSSGMATVDFTTTAAANSSTTITSTDAQNVTGTSASITTLPANAFSKLQLLLPGESAAPGTQTGKTGSPSAQTAENPFAVTVNAVDANWNVVTNITDLVGITCSDANAIRPASTNLVLGSGTLVITLNTPVTNGASITASDLSDPNKLPNTSPPFTVNGPPYIAASGGATISADTTGGAFTTLTGPVYSEPASGAVGAGTIIINLPAGFVFDTSGVAPSGTTSTALVAARPCL